MDVNVVMLGVFCIFALGAAVLYVLAGRRYDEIVQPLDEKAYRLKKLMPAGLYLLNAIGYRFNTSYDRKLLVKIAEIHGQKYAQYYLYVHWANKIAFVIAGLLLAAFIGMSTGPDTGFIAFSILVLGGIVYFTDYELDEKVKRKRFAIQMDFPDFLNKLTLLINAGMTVFKAWEKIAGDNKKSTPLYEEIQTTLAEIKAGETEIKAYENFARRCRNPEVTRFISVILQNIKKGNSELVAILGLMAGECWQMRKNAAKRLGEEASTRMLLPMMIMFFAILIIVAVPAIISLQGI